MKIDDLPEIPARYKAVAAGAAVGLSIVFGTGFARSRTRVSKTGGPPKGLAARFTTPLLPDDYLNLINPLWSTRELRGRVDKVVKETETAATLVIRPGWGWSFDHKAGQYVGIGVDVDGKWIWRSYSLTVPPSTNDAGHIAITVKAMPEGFMSKHLVDGLAPGSVVRLALPKGEFVLPDPPPKKMLFLTGGSGVTPVMAMLRTLDRRDSMPDVVIAHSAPNKNDVIFGEELQQIADKYDTVKLHLQYSETDGHFELSQLDEVCPDWRKRQVWACGPEALLDSAEEWWKEADLEDNLHLERFAAKLSEAGEGGHVTFKKSGKEADIDGAKTLMEAGEELGVEMPYGCRMGICHTCTVPLISGTVRDLRNGNEYDEHDEKIQTCVTAAAGDVVIEV
ncbi:MAG: stearoyl-CoA 9-desaturase oxidoreductase [Frankiaceae bacterium]|jgi:ferredoxin-NADP reductase|nr:stearoyl-CoA 9-desaturase oxidoreductase [Frankiaceae bacterium]